MKQILFLLAVVVSLLSCTKEKEETTLTGVWTLTQINSGSTSSVFLYGSELSIEFKKNDTLVILGPKPNYTFLQDFNRYKIVSNNRIRFYNTGTQDELFASYRMDKNLQLSYEVRCPYEEKFIRR